MIETSGIIIVDKEKDYTSRDVVNIISKKLKTKKVGHTGTLDPLATGVLVICVNKATKLVEVLTSSDKEYVATMKLGIKTDTGDITGNIIEKSNITPTNEEIKNIFRTFPKKYMQTVPIYSAVKVNGKKLYEYAREDKIVKLPKREVEIKELELLEINSEIKFRVVVSKGTYIRSLIEDIAEKLNTVGTMTNLNRTRQGDFKITEAIKVEEVSENSLIPIKNVLKQKKIVATGQLYEKVKNGAIIDNNENEEILFVDCKENLIALYKTYEKDKTKMKPYKMF